MKLLLDAELISLINKKSLLQHVKDPGRQVKEASVDLTVGDIFQPGVNEHTLGSHCMPRKQISLSQGETAVVRTAETVTLDATHGGIVFPVATVSLNGLLMTNPGHVDPGYCGPLHVTVINMGREAYALKHGDRLLRALFFEFSDSATRLYGKFESSPINAELLARLSHDFVDVENRASSAARDTIRRAELRIRAWQVGVPVLIGLLAIVASMWTTYSQLGERLIKLESTVPIQREVDALKLKTLRDLEQRLSALETLRSPK